LIYNATRFEKTQFLELFILTFILTCMASIVKRKKSKFWTACYTSHDGRQLKRSTKSTDKNQALEIALNFERVEKQAKQGALTSAKSKRVFNDVSEKVTGDILEGQTKVMKTGTHNGSLQILQLEDSLDDRHLTRSTLDKDGVECKIRTVATRDEFESAIKEVNFDLIISDYTLPFYDGKSALDVARKFQPETPFILLSGTIGEERAVEFLKSGAADCVLKDNLERLGPAVRRALLEAEERAKRKQAEEALKVQAAQLRALAARLQASREEERIRISREIHDEFGHVLASQKFALTWIQQQVETLKPSGSRDQILEKVDYLKKLADETANRVRKLCTELRPSILDDLGLLVALEWQAREFQTRTNIRCEFVQHLDAVDLDSEKSTAVFRIFQEILTNVARHSKASKVRVTLKAGKNRLLLQIKDNGCGFSKGSLADGGSLGILGMHERAALFDGELVIQSAPGKGTAVTVSVPMALSDAKQVLRKRKDSVR
jgi:signal transduction histidine kinase